MRKVISLLIAAGMVAATPLAFAAAHGGAMKDDKKADCTKLEGKAKADCEAAAKKAAEMKK